MQPKPPHSLKVAVNLWLADAEAGDADALREASKRITENPGYDWAEQRAKAERIADSPDYGQKVSQS